MDDQSVKSNEAIREALEKKCKIHHEKNADLIHLVS